MSSLDELAIRDRRIRLGQDGMVWYQAKGDIESRWVDVPNPILEQARRYFGRALSPETIEHVIRMADYGYMRDLTDLTYEATRIDPHFSMCDSKRLRAVYTAKVNVIQATGDAIDEPTAKLYADVVRQQLAWIPNLRQVLCRLNWGHKHGRAAAEKIWRQNPAGSEVKWRIDRINWIHPRRLSFGPERELRVRDDVWGGLGFEARGLSLKEYPYKFIAFTPQQFDEYPEREGYGPRALYFTFFKRFGWREELVLLEVFGRPWRHVEETDPARPAQGDTLKDAAEQVDKMAANATGYAPPGTRIVTEQPGQGAGQVHQNVKVDANDEISKLVLGEVRTSDAKPGALGSSGEQVAADVQSEVKQQDVLDLSDCLTEQFAVDVIALNYDGANLDHCPRIEVFYEPPVDRSKEIERTAKVFDMGIALKEDQVYERVGFDKPGPQDATIKKQAPPPMGLPGAGALPGAAPGDSSPTGDGSGGKSVDDQANLAAPPSFLPWARAAHVLELAQHLSSPARVVRTAPGPDPKIKPEPEG
jgi:phage gp29-like protein